MNDIIKVKI